MKNQSYDQAVKNLKKLRAQKLKFEGRKLRILRMVSELTQTDFAEICGISQAHLCMMEKGKASVPTEVFQRLKVWKENL